MGSDDVRARVAKALVRSSQIREASWDGEYTYRKTNSQVVKEACLELGCEDWETLLACLMTAGYAEIWEWCAQQGVKL